jgi:hypothetical protein
VLCRPAALARLYHQDARLGDEGLSDGSGADAGSPRCEIRARICVHVVSGVVDAMLADILGAYVDLIVQPIELPKDVPDAGDDAWDVLVPRERSRAATRRMKTAFAVRGCICLVSSMSSLSSSRPSSSSSTTSSSILSS